MSGNHGRLRNAYYSSVTSAIYQVVSIVCGFILPKIILEAYGSTYNGVVSSITQFLGFFSVLQAGIQGSTRVALYKSLANNDHEKTSSIILANEKFYRRMSFFLVGYIIILAIVFALLFSDEISVIDVVFLTLVIGLSNFAQYFFGNAYKALLSADQAYYVINILQTVTLIINTVLCAMIIFAGGSIVLAKLGSAFVYGLNPIVLYVYVKKKYKLRKDVIPDQSALKNRWDVLANSIANIVHENVDVLFITLFCAASEISVYAVYSIVSSGLIRLMQVFTSGVEAAFGNMWAKDEKELLKKNFRKYEYVMYIIAGTMSGCMAVLILPFVSIYTENVHDAEYFRPLFALLLTLALATMCIRQPYVTMVQAAGHYKQTKNGSIAEAVINIVLTVIFIHVIGIEGAVLGTVVANTFRTVQYGLYVSKHLIQRKMSEIVYRMLWITITTCCAAFLSRILISFLSISGWKGWVLSGIICGIIHVAVIVVMSFVFYRNDLLSVARHILKLRTKK